MQNTPKRQTRGGRAAKAMAPGVAVPRRPVGPRPTTVALVERIVDLQIRQVPLETFASEILPLLLDTFDAPAGAMLLYHCETESLAMVASRGLSPAGHQHLESLRRGAADSWEIPLHGLLNRKAYIIERPDEHPFVPELVARDLMPRTANLASIPLYRGQLPVGVLLAIADRRAIGEPEILAQVLAFDVLALALDAHMRARVLASPPPVTTGAADGPVVCEEWVDPREIAARLEAELASERAARDELAARLADAEAWVTTATAASESVKGDYARLLAERTIEIERARASERQLSEATLTEVREELAARDATIAARDGSLAAIAAQRDRTVAILTEERDGARDAASEAGDLTRQLRDTLAALEGERDTLRAAQAKTLVRATTADAELARLGTELAELRTEAARLRDDRARVLAAVDEPGAEPATVIRALREKVATLDSEVGAFAGERAELARRAAVQAEKVAQQIAQQRRELEELRATHERGVTELAAAHARALEDARTAEQRALAETIRDRQHILAAAEERQQAAIAALRAEHAEALAQALAERDARRDELERVAAQRDDLETRVMCALAEREEAAAGASVRERAAVARLETERRQAALERQTLQEQLAAAERVRAEHTHHFSYLDRELAARDEHATALARTIDERDAQLAAVHAEVVRLREDRERVLAVVDDPGAEPGAVIQALRERVAAFENQLRGFDDERAQMAQRAAAELEQSEHRLAVQRRELAEARAAHRAELETALAATRREIEQSQADHHREREQDRALHAEEVAALRTAGDRLEAERRAALGRIESDRDAAHATVRELRAVVAARETALSEREQALAGVEAERVRLAEAAATATAERERVEAAVAALERDRAAIGKRLAALERAEAEYVPRLATLAAERDQQDTQKAEIEARAEQLATELAIVQAEALRLREDRARVLAAVDDETAEPVTVLRALREQVAALEGQLAAHAAERAELARRADAEARTVEERLAIERAEREAAEAEHRRTFAAAQAVHARALEEAAAARRRELEQSAAAHRRGLEELAAAHQRAVAEHQAAVTRLEAQRRAAAADAEAARRALADERGTSAARLADVRASRLTAEADVRSVRLAAESRTAHVTPASAEASSRSGEPGRGGTR